MSLLRISSGKLVMWIGLLLLSTSCIVPRVQASVGMTDVDEIGRASCRERVYLEV